MAAKQRFRVQEYIELDAYRDDKTGKVMIRGYLAMDVNQYGPDDDLLTVGMWQDTHESYRESHARDIAETLSRCGRRSRVIKVLHDFEAVELARNNVTPIR